MHIKSITVDGFKSYAQRTEIRGFDPLFNAITGLNGSGKSNILDSICFLLGITNLSQVGNYHQFFFSLCLIILIGFHFINYYFINFVSLFVVAAYFLVDHILLCC